MKKAKNDENDLSDLDDLQLPYLEKILDLNELKRGQANLIIAPCHSGKTTAARKIMEHLARSPTHVLFLIDTTSGKEAIMKREKGQRCTQAWIHRYDPLWWGDRPDRTNFSVMTYHQFGYAYQEMPSFLTGIDLIICDEMHNLIKYIAMETDEQEAGDTNARNCCQTALTVLADLASRVEDAPLIVIMTATPRKVIADFKELDTPYKSLNYYGRVRSDKTQQVIYYTDFAWVMDQLMERAVIYVPTIQLMKEFAKIADTGLEEICCLWSVHSQEEMDDKQMAVRRALLETERIPEDIDFLFLNAAYETALNIRNEDFRTMVIHCSNKEIQTQVRGRLRHDIDTLYLYDAKHEHVGDYFPKTYLNRWLNSEDIGKLEKQLHMKNAKGRLLKWKSIWPILELNGMEISVKRMDNKRYWLIEPPINAE